MTEEHKAHLEIGRLDESAPSTPHNILVKLDGKVLSRLQKVEIILKAETPALVILTMIPDELKVDLEGIKTVLEKEK